MAPFSAPDPWPWSDVEDEAVCTRALGALCRMGVLERPDRAWLAHAVKQAVGSPAGTRIPWAAWTIRICERTGILKGDRGFEGIEPAGSSPSWTTATT